MSANNWGICPKCKQARREALADLEKRASETYGEIPEDEYLALLAQVKAGLPELTHTLPEYYEIFMGEDGEFYIRYSAHCTVCNFSHEFKKSDQVL